MPSKEKKSPKPRIGGAAYKRATGKVSLTVLLSTEAMASLALAAGIAGTPKSRFAEQSIANAAAALIAERFPAK